MGYRKEELNWIGRLIENDILLAEEQMKECMDFPQLYALAELRRDNMTDLLEKTRQMIKKEITKGNRRNQQERGQ